MKFFWFLATLIGCFHNNIAAHEELKKFLEDLKPQERSILEWFFRNCSQSFGGYVLFGDKPMCLESFLKEPVSFNLSEYRIAKMKAFEILKNWNCADNDYLFLFCDYPYNSKVCFQHSHLIIINRKSFIRTVNENLFLFRYVLGRTLTAETLLEELIRNQHRFWEILKEDNVLIGILFGYGTNNSLIVSRCEDIAKQATPQIDSFPFSLSFVSNQPMLGFNSLREERKSLAQMTLYSRDMLQTDSYHIPAFGCVPNSTETNDLLTLYEKNRNTIISNCKDPDFLKNLIKKIFRQFSGEIKIPAFIPRVIQESGNSKEMHPKFDSSEAGVEVGQLRKLPDGDGIKFSGYRRSQNRFLNHERYIDNPSLFDPSNKKKLAAQFAEVLSNTNEILDIFPHSNININISKKLNKNNLVNSLLQGIVDEENGNTPQAFSNSELCELNTLPLTIECCQRLISANHLFRKISNLKNWSIPIPGGVAYQILRPGKGKPASSKLKRASFHISYRLGAEHEFTHFETIRNTEVSEFVPGIVHSLIGMKKGEQRLVCIHPKYAYGIQAQPINAIFIAEMQLIDFQEGEKDAVCLDVREVEPSTFYMSDEDIAPKPLFKYNLDKCNHEDLIAIYSALLCKFQTLTEKKLYICGHAFWRECKKIEIPFDEFILQMKSDRKAKCFMNLDEVKQFIVDYKLFLFNEAFKDGKVVAFPQSWF